MEKEDLLSVENNLRDIVSILKEKQIPNTFASFQLDSIDGLYLLELAEQALGLIEYNKKKR